MNRPAQIKRPAIKQLMQLEAILLVLITLVFWQWDSTRAYSILLGGSSFLIPSAYFAWRSFRAMGGANAQQVVNGFYQGQATKFVLTAVMFAAIFILVKPLDVLVIFISYGLSALVHFIATGVILNRPNRI